MMQPTFTPASGTSRFVMIDANSLTQFDPIVGVHPLLVELWALRTHPAVAFTFIFAVGSLGVYMLLPGVNAFSESAVKWFGGPLAGISLVLLASLLSVRVVWWPQIPEDEQVSPVVFAVPAAISLVAALRAVTSRRTAVCVLWLAALLASNAVLFLLHGSRFSAGANVVLALAALAAWRFWLMPAAKVARVVDEDHSQTAGEPFLACLTGGLLCVVLVTAVTQATRGAGITEIERLARTFADKRAALVDAQTRQSASDSGDTDSSSGGHRLLSSLRAHPLAALAGSALLVSTLAGAIGIAKRIPGAGALDGEAGNTDLQLREENPN